MKHNGLKPSAQPRSLRSITEGHNPSGGFPAPYQLPAWEGDSEPYRDDADAAKPTTGTSPRPADPQPMRNLRGGNR